MALNIKNQRVHELASELARLTGETLTGAVAVALEERLARERRLRGKATAEELLEIGRRAAAGLVPKPIDGHAELLYDERGLPR